MTLTQWNLGNSKCRGSQEGLSYEKLELWVLLSLFFNQSYKLCSPYVATVGSPFRSSVSHFLAKLSKICEIFFSCEKKKMKLSLLNKNVGTSGRIEGNLMALTSSCQFELWLKVGDVPSKLSLPRQGPWNLVWVKQVFELSEVEITKCHCIWVYMQFSGKVTPRSGHFLITRTLILATFSLQVDREEKESTDRQLAVAKQKPWTGTPASLMEWPNPI